MEHSEKGLSGVVVVLVVEEEEEKNFSPRHQNKTFKDSEINRAAFNKISNHYY